MLEDRLALTALPAGFVETLITTQSDLSAPTAMEFSPLGELWVLEQAGRVKLVRGDGTAHTALTLPVDSAGERGLLGIAFDPAYDGAGPNPDYAYLYYTSPRTSSTDPANNRLSRFTVTGAGSPTATLASELILRDLPPEDEDHNPATNGDTNHNGGAIHFGPDGKLYVAVGDHNYDTAPQSSHVSQILTTPFGKILRLNADGSNPGDNPFYSGSPMDWQGSIWALGLRNPYTFAFQAGTGTMFLNDVGEGVWEEINRGEPAANYGWAGSTAPLWEGFESPPPAWANYRDPVMAYDHSNSPPSPFGCAITGGVFYPHGGPFGNDYAGKYLFADFCGNFIRVFDPANPGSLSAPDTSIALASNLSTGNPVDLKVDAAGNLYYLAYGSTGEIYRISAQARVVQDGTTVTVTGTTGSDQFTFDASAGITITINGASYPFTAPEATAFSFNGLGGNDDVQIIGSSGVDTAVIRPSQASFRGSGYTLAAVNIESTTFHGGDGEDTARLYGSRGSGGLTLAGAGSAVGVPQATYAGAGLAITATAEILYAHGNGGKDTAELHKLAESDLFQPFWRSARMSGQGYASLVYGFGSVAVHVPASSLSAEAFFLDEARDSSFPNGQADKAVLVDAAVAQTTDGLSTRISLDDLSQLLWLHEYERQRPRTGWPASNSPIREVRHRVEILPQRDPHVFRQIDPETHLAIGDFHQFDENPLVNDNPFTFPAIVGSHLDSLRNATSTDFDSLAR